MVREVEPIEDPVTAVTLSDEELEAVAGGMNVSTDAPSKLREATRCYLTDAASDKTFDVVI